MLLARRRLVVRCRLGASLDSAYFEFPNTLDYRLQTADYGLALGVSTEQELSKVDRLQDGAQRGDDIGHRRPK